MPTQLMELGELPSLVPRHAAVFGSTEYWDTLQYPQYQAYSVKDPFAGIFGFDRELRQLEYLLLSGGGAGHCVLVTGHRGTGKTTLINQAVFHAAALGRGQVVLGEPIVENPLILAEAGRSGPEDLPASTHGRIEWLHDTMYTRGVRIIALRPTSRREHRRLLLEVRLNVARPLGVDVLVSRIIRRCYTALVEAGIAALAPRLIQRARYGFLRSYGDIGFLKKAPWRERARLELPEAAVSIEALQVQLGAEAQREFELAKEITLSLPHATLEDTEDELIQLIREINVSSYGGIAGAQERLARLGSWVQAIAASKRDGDQGGLSETERVTAVPFIDVHILLIFDELDKLLDRGGGRVARLDLKANLGDTSASSPAANMSGSEDAHSERVWEEKEASRKSWGLGNLVGELKPLLTAGNATFVMVADEERIA